MERPPLGGEGYQRDGASSRFTHLIIVTKISKQLSGELLVDSKFSRVTLFDSQVPLRNFYGPSLPHTQSCNKGLESNYRSRYNSNSNQNDKHLFLIKYFSLADSEDTSNQNPETRNHSQRQPDRQREFKEHKKDSALFTKMWWADLKAAFGQRINFEGILCSTMVILKDPKLSLPHISVPDIRYIDWAALRRKGFKGVVFDKDNTITVPYSLTLWPSLESSLESCKSEFGHDIAVFSNSAGLREYDHDGSKARNLEGTIGIKVIRHRVKKPGGTAEEIEKHFGCEASELIMVGDRPFTDIVYGNRNGFLTIWTEPLSLAEEPFIVKQQPGGVIHPKAQEKVNLGAIHASKATTPTTTTTQRWILEPVGDGDSRHIGFKVERPGAYEITSNEVTVGRVPEKADLVIPVATVSGVHARIRIKQDNLLVIDLDSTNGTFIGDKRLKPGVVTTVSSGSYITFGDTNLAMFRVSKIEEKAADTVGEPEGELENDGKSDSTETSSTSS